MREQTKESNNGERQVKEGSNGDVEENPVSGDLETL